MIKSYIRSDNIDTRAIKDILNPGDIIVASNIASRGTDIKISSKVLKNGGLHIILTYLPDNSRVEK